MTALAWEVIGTAVATLLAGFIIGWWLGRRREHALSLDVAILEARLKSEEALEQERLASMDRTIERLKSTFDDVAGASLRTNSEIFLQLAREHLGRHEHAALTSLSEREKAIDAMLAPIREALHRTGDQIQRIEKERAESFGSLRQSLETVALAQQALQRETRSLVNALRRPEVRGRWGEITLRRLAELAGMIEHCDFSEQVQVRGDDRALRPDMIVHMPDGRDLVVDVKTPLDAYLEAMDAPSDEDRARALKRHAQCLAERVGQLAAKNYWAQFDKSPDFVILFIPGDQFLSAALAEIPGLLDEAIRQNVILATPSSLVALLKAVAYGWRQTTLAKNAETIRVLAEDLYRRLAAFTTHLARLGRQLGSSVEAFNSAVGSLERQVLPGARKFTDLGVRAAKDLETLDPIEQLARAPQSLEDDPTLQPTDGSDACSR